MSKKSRLDKLYPALSARERALLVLTARKNDTTADPRVRTTIPDSQVNDFNRYIGLMNGANQHLGPFLLYLHSLVQQLSLRQGWLTMIRVWALRDVQLALAVFRAVKQPITKDKYMRRIKEERKRTMPIEKAAETAMGRYDDWQHEDSKAVEGNEHADMPEARTRELAAKKREIAALIKDGTIAGEGRGRSQEVNAGSLYDWIGEEVPVHPDWGLEYEIHPDPDYEQIKRIQEGIRGIREALSDSPALSPLSTGFVNDLSETSPTLVDEVSEGLVQRIQESVPYCWSRLCAIDTVLEEVRAEFGGEDALTPELRSTLNQAREELSRVRDGLTALGYEVGMEETKAEPDEELLAHVRSLVNRELRI